MTTLELAWRIRRHAVEMTNTSKGSHIASILSVADIIAVLYNDVLNVNSEFPNMNNRDRFILSKGHAGAAIYAALAEKGFFPLDKLKTHYADGSDLSGHVSHKGVPGVEFSTGSLGHGLPVACGMALALKKKNIDAQVYVVLGDGECDEGSNWEAALFANHNKLDNLVIIVDYNKMQSLDYCEKTIKLEPFSEKWRAFGCDVLECDGNDVDSLKKVFFNRKKSGKPFCVLAHTTKGKGISFMENNILWHYRSPQDEEYLQAVRELEKIKP